MQHRSSLYIRNVPKSKRAYRRRASEVTIDITVATRGRCHLQEKHLMKAQTPGLMCSNSAICVISTISQDSPPMIGRFTCPRGGVHELDMRFV